MNSDDALQESNEDRDTFADESKHCVAFYNVDPATHARTRLSTRPKWARIKVWDLQVIGGGAQVTSTEKQIESLLNKRIMRYNTC